MSMAHAGATIFRCAGQPGHLLAAKRPRTDDGRQTTRKEQRILTRYASRFTKYEYGRAFERDFGLTDSSFKGILIRNKVEKGEQSWQRISAGAW